MGSDARTALVTGATGFIGGRLANALVDDRWQLRALVRGFLRRFAKTAAEG